jgi:hypothetical protein
MSVLEFIDRNPIGCLIALVVVCSMIIDVVRSR